MQFSYFFDYVHVFSKFHTKPFDIIAISSFHMVRNDRRFSDESWEESLGDGRTYGYGAGARTSVATAGFNRDSKEGDVSG
jgi:hypothetical protein